MTDASDEAGSEGIDILAARLSSRADYRAKIMNIVDRYPLVAFYGVGAIFPELLATWNEYVGRPIDLCCDSDPAKWGETFGGVTCVSPAELSRVKDRCAVFLTLGEFHSVLESLKMAGFPSVSLVFGYDLVASDFLASQDTQQVATNLAQTRRLLEDDCSREVFDAIVTRVVGDGADSNPMEAVFEPDQYFSPEVIQLGDDESFVDVGAFDGDTVKEFLERTGGEFRHITCFEVDPENHQRLVENVNRWGEGERITVHDVGLWDSNCVIALDPGKTQSTVGTGSGSCNVVRLDDVMGDERITLMKMDIEGAESRALRGASRIIQSQKPRLAICVYHHIRDLWEIPLAIHEMVPEYKLYLRHHTNLEYETVCYAAL